MLENAFLRRLLYTNTLILICVTFTIATLLDLILTVITLGDVGTTYQHLGTRFVICAFVSVSLLVFRFFKKLPFALIMVIHFLAILFFSVLYIWISGFFIEQHPRAMFYMVRSVLIIYIFIAVGCIALDCILKARRKRKSKNQNLLEK